MENKSHLTARTRNKLSKPMEIIRHNLHGRCLDYGCGKGFDSDKLGIERYDLYYFPNKPEGKFDCIVCNYVLCVVPEEESIAILEDIRSMLTDDGEAFISVRRDKKNLNGWTKRQTFQRNVELDEEVWIEIKNSFCIYRIRKEKATT